METVAVGDIHQERLYRGIAMPMWVLYDHPRDLPDHFVLRLWDGMTATATPFVFLADSLEGIEAQIEAVPGRFAKLARFDQDDPKIVAAYL